MPFDVTMPDGTTIRGVPDGTTKSQLMMKLQKVSPAAAPSPLQAPVTSQKAPTMPQIAAAPAQQPGFIDRLGQDIERRKQAVLQAQDLPNFLISSARLGVGPVTDVVAQGYKSLPEDIRNPIETMATLGYESLPRSVRQPIEKTVQAGAELAKENPTLANLGGYLTEATLAKPSAKIATSAVPGTGTLKDVAKGFMAPSKEAIDTMQTNLHRKGQSTIEGLKNSGIILNPEVTFGKLMSEMDSTVNPFKTGAKTATDKAGRTVRVDTSSQEAARSQTNKILNDMRTSMKPKAKVVNGRIEIESYGDTSIRNLLGFREQLDNIAKGAPDADTAAATAAKRTLDNFIDKQLKEEGYKNPNMAQFRKEFMQQKNFEEVSDIFIKNQDNPKAMRKALVKFNNSENFAMIPKDVQKSLKKAASGTLTGNTLDAIGSVNRWLMGGSAVAGVGAAMLGAPAAIPAAVAGVVGTAAARGAGKKIQQGLAGEALKKMAKEPKKK